MRAETLVQEGIREFVATQVAPRAPQVDQEGSLPVELWQSMGTYGLTGLLVPEPYGGVGAELPAALGAIEAVAGGCGSTAWALLAHTSAELAIMAAGSDVQKQRYLRPLASGEWIGAALVATEAGGGSNPMTIQTFAQLDGDQYVLNGSKTFITQAGSADVYVVLARTDPAPAPSSLTAFVVERDAPGLRFGKREQTMGLRGVSIADIYFDDCRIPSANVLGAPGGAMGVLGAVSGFALLGSAAAALGMAQAALDQTRSYVKERQVLGQPLASVAGVQQKVATCMVELEAARGLFQSALSWRQGGASGPPVLPWMAKIHCTEAAWRIIDRCLGLHGAYGYASSLPLERMLRDARALSIHWGNNDVLLDNLGKQALA